MVALVIELLKKHEGFRNHVYRCTAGKKTIGYGYNLDANPLDLASEKISDFEHHGITESAASLLLRCCVDDIEFNLEQKIACWPKLNEVRQAVLINMAFNLGVEGLMRFTHTFACLNREEYRGASLHMIESNWARQVKGRSAELATLMLTGKHP